MTFDAFDSPIDGLEGVLDIAPSPPHLQETLTLATEAVETLYIDHRASRDGFRDGSDSLFNAELGSGFIDALDGKVEVLHDAVVMHIVLWIDIHFVVWIRSYIMLKRMSLSRGI